MIDFNTFLYSFLEMSVGIMLKALHQRRTNSHEKSMAFVPGCSPAYYLSH